MRKLLSLLTVLTTVSPFSVTPVATLGVAQAADDPHYVASGTIVIDGDLTEWEDYDNLLPGEEADVTGVTYYWDLIAQDWTTTNPGYETITTNVEKMFDFLEMKMVHDDDFMYMMNEKVAGLYNVNIPFSFGPPAAKSVVASTVPTGTYSMPYSENYPAPTDVDVDQIMMFDTDGDGDNDYYVVINFQWNAGDFWEDMPDGPSPDVEPPFAVAGSLYRESDADGGTYDGKGSETFIQSFDASDVSMMPEMPDMENPTALETSREEGKQDRGIIFDQMDINWNDSVRLSYATVDNSSGAGLVASAEANFIDESAAATYTFDSGITPASIITAAGPGGGPHVRSFTTAGIAESDPDKLMAYADTYRGGVRVATGDIDSDGVDEIITGTGENGGPHLRVFEKDGTQRGIEFFPFDSRFRGGMDVASGDFDGDGKEDIAVSQFSKGQAWVKVYKYNTNRDILFERNVFGAPECGATVAMGQLDNDASKELIVGAGGGCSTQVVTFDYKLNTLEGILKPITYNLDIFTDGDFIGAGVDVATGDIDNNGKDEIAVSRLKDRSSQIKVFRYNEARTELSDFLAYGDYIVGANIEMADIDSDGQAEIITGAGPTGGPQVRAFEYDGTAIDETNFFAYNENFRGGVSVAVGNF